MLFRSMLLALAVAIISDISMIQCPCSLRYTLSSSNRRRSSENHSSLTASSRKKLDFPGLACRLGLCFKMLDNGEGIEKSDIKNIFKRFYKGKNSINPKSIGIGLSLSKKIIEAHDGSIAVESEIGKGTNFTITLLKVIV